MMSLIALVLAQSLAGAPAPAEPLHGGHPPPCATVGHARHADCARIRVHEETHSERRAHHEVRAGDVITLSPAGMVTLDGGVGGRGPVFISHGGRVFVSASSSAFASARASAQASARVRFSGGHRGGGKHGGH